MSACSASCTCTFLRINKYQQGNKRLVLSPCNQDVVRAMVFIVIQSVLGSARVFFSVFSRQLLRVSFCRPSRFPCTHPLPALIFTHADFCITLNQSWVLATIFATTRQCCKQFVALWISRKKLSEVGYRHGEHTGPVTANFHWDMEKGKRGEGQGKISCVSWRRRRGRQTKKGDGEGDERRRNLKGEADREGGGRMRGE